MTSIITEHPRRDPLDSVETRPAIAGRGAGSSDRTRFDVLHPATRKSPCNVADVPPAVPGKAVG
ncbi:hypothetical protein GCM10010191_19340 [Actinomadura vinacea]|uniref:Uncharacterized protein n=1 Tax=Actinomadura vinacea TaxID=115336 RepID=A0ABN3IPP0_9ACTN